MEWISTAAQITIILSFFGAAFSFMILKPLNTAIKELKEAIDKLSAKFERVDERQRLLEVRVAELDQRTKSLHRRVDVIDTHLGVDRREDHDVYKGDDL
jgi:DNA-binding transcriptional MerR regulator